MAMIRVYDQCSGLRGAGSTMALLRMPTKMKLRDTRCLTVWSHNQLANLCWGGDWRIYLFKGGQGKTGRRWRRDVAWTPFSCKS